jgi:hypothetical protein
MPTDESMFRAIPFYSAKYIELAHTAESAGELDLDAFYKALKDPGILE